MKHPLEDPLKNNPFTAPEGYFDRLDETIRQRITEKTLPVLWKRNVLRLASVAAGLALIAWFLMPAAQPQTAEEILAQISEEEITLYLEVHDALAGEDVLLPAGDETMPNDILFYDTILQF